MKNIGIYVHIPFCKQKCKYCDFISFKHMEDKYDEYFKYLVQEILEKADEINYEVIVDTIYIGGGTPSIVSEKYIEQIIEVIKNNFKVIENPEITIEVNPGTVDELKLNNYLKMGINRLSMGLQSTNDKLLELFGRVYTYSEFKTAYALARKVGFKNINVDLMIGLPKQTLKDVIISLNEIIDKLPEHISVYSLIVEENTQLYDLIENCKLKLPSERVERKMYWKVKDVLEKSGYNHYEISNFSKSNFESKHNSNCWEQHDYVGFGVAAHSYYNGRRYSNITNLKQYIDNLKNGQSVYNIIFHESQNDESKMKEYMLLGLRKINGVSISEFKNKFAQNPLYLYRNELNKLIQKELISVEGDFIKLTNKGIDLANMVWMEFV